MPITRPFPTAQEYDQKALEQLAETGIAIGPGGLVILEDLHAAERAQVHRRMVLPAAIGWSLVSTLITKGAFPHLTMMDGIAMRPSMDCPDTLALAKVTGAHPPSPYADPQAFHHQLEHVLAHYDLWRFFQRDQRPGRANGHQAIRPAGIDLDLHEFIDHQLAAWRRDFKALPPVRQMMLATIICLYRGENDNNAWLKRLSTKWHIAEAVVTLRDGGALADWGRLVALYPGW